ncbi:MAG: hypothetical protein U9R36_00110, partial [Elusimicrobiota bacterium]|nr:hypothetical protein [Elusimicrobiota bacterium]
MKIKIFAVTGLIILLFAAPPAFSATRQWSGSLNDLASVNGNWALGGPRPAGGDEAFFNNANNCSWDYWVDLSSLTLNEYTGQVAVIVSSLTITDSFYKNSGLFSCGASTINLQGDFEDTGGLFEPGTGQWIFSGSAAQELNGILFFNNFKVDSSSTVALNSSLDIMGDLLVENGTLQASAEQIQLDGDLTQNGGDITGPAGFC